jgi:hypothetical protein
MIMRGIKIASGKLTLDLYEERFWGMGVPDLKDLNLCLIGSWVRRYIRDENRLLRSIIDKKYCKHGNMFCSDKTHASPFWKGVIMAAQAMKFGYKWLPGNGKKIRF